MKRKLRIGFTIFLLFILLVGCSSNENADNRPTFKILAGSEIKVLEPLIVEFEKDKGYNIELVTKGSVDSMLELQSHPENYDAIWSASSSWIRMGDTKNQVKHDKSVMTSPVVFGIKKSKAEELGFVGKDVTIRDILDKVKKSELDFLMTSASQSNSGNSAYIGMIYALLGNPDMITNEQLQDPTLKKEIKELLLGINRGSGSSGWLSELAVKGDYEAMVNYESLIIDANKKLVNEGKEPYYLVYPKDGLTVADHTLGYISNGDAAKEKFFKEFQDYLLSEPVQNKILALGSRTGFGGQVKNADKTVFNPEWGIDTEKIITPQKFPSEDVMLEAIQLYQTELKKPSYTIIALDYSGSMADAGEKEMKKAMDVLLTQEKAKRYLLQASNEDIIQIIPFSSKVLDVWTAKGTNEYGKLNSKVQSFVPNGGTDIYSPTIKGFDLLKNIDVEKYNPAIILMTDGESNEGRSYGDVENYFNSLNKDIPVFSITFGDSSDEQLKEISELTNGKVFNGKDNLIQAFKEAKGYN